jgi:hypothetical protein
MEGATCVLSRKLLIDIRSGERRVWRCRPSGFWAALLIATHSN